MKALRATRCIFCGEIVLMDHRGMPMDLPDPDHLSEGAIFLKGHACYPGLRQARADYLAAVHRAFPKGATHADH